MRILLEAEWPMKRTSVFRLLGMEVGEQSPVMDALLSLSSTLRAIILGYSGQGRC